MNQLFHFLDHYVSFTESEKYFISSACTYKQLNKNDFFLLQGKTPTTLAILTNGAFRFFHTNEGGEEINTEFILDHGFVTNLLGFIESKESHLSVQAMENSDIIILDWRKIQLEKSLCRKFKILGSLYLNKVCLPALLHYQLLMSETPNKRYALLLKKYPHYAQRIAQKHLASYLRLRPETVSRIRKNLLI